mmetsp:Transcript_34568/g.84083  ORF Transcript_34568/g.84083 Transcript_34568/m.84083 type:complete len:270 (-) Transcript_34568:3472-4281(-)
MLASFAPDPEQNVERYSPAAHVEHERQRTSSIPAPVAQEPLVYVKRGHSVQASHTVSLRWSQARATYCPGSHTAQSRQVTAAGLPMPSHRPLRRCPSAHAGHALAAMQSVACDPSHLPLGTEPSGHDDGQQSLGLLLLPCSANMAATPSEFSATSHTTTSSRDPFIVWISSSSDHAPITNLAPVVGYMTGPDWAVDVRTSAPSTMSLIVVLSYEPATWYQVPRVNCSVVSVSCSAASEPSPLRTKANDLPVTEAPRYQPIPPPSLASLR